MGSRDLKELTPELFDKYQLFNIKMGETGLIHIVTRTSCTIVEQMALYTMGRLPLADVNTFRKVAELYLIDQLENRIVTWTLNSKHVTNMFDKDLNNDKAGAFDIALLKAGKATWDLKVDVNANEIPDYDEAGRIGESVGLIWGGIFKNPDRPHFEIERR